jgi:Ca-activated chloride channel family protein
MSSLIAITDDFTLPDRLAMPWMLAFTSAILLIIVARILPRFTQKSTAIALPTADLLVRSDRSVIRSLSWTPLVLRICAIACLSYACARPQQITQIKSVSTEAVAIQLCIDRSSSMLEVVSMGGRQLSRLDAVKSIANEFVLGNGEDLRGRPGDLVGATVFAGFAETVCPPVREHDALAGMIQRIEPAKRSLREDGTAIGDGLASAVARLVRAERALALATEPDSEADQGSTLGGFSIKSKVVVLMTDGRSQQGVSPIEAARLAAEQGVRVYAIGIGSDGEQAGGIFSMLAGSALDDRLLRDIAEMTGGRFWFADNADTLRDIYRQIDQLESTEIRSESDFIPRELFAPWALLGLLAISMDRLLAATLFRRTL